VLLAASVLGGQFAGIVMVNPKGKNHVIGK
jgi:hypothetical protein